METTPCTDRRSRPSSETETSISIEDASLAGVRLGFRFLGAMLVGDIPISFFRGREDAEKTTGTVSQCNLSHRDAG